METVAGEDKLYRKAYYLSLFTIAYNIVEGIVSLIFGYSDETMTLFGFGLDSFIEVVSGTGILIMILRIGKNPSSEKGSFEKTALKITGTSFYILATGLTIGIFIDLFSGHKPETTLSGVIISLISIAVMFWLMSSKYKTGCILRSDPIIADSKCTKVCVYMSVVLLVSSLIYELTGFIYADEIGTAGLVYFSFTEGKEAFELAH
jgi:divalent metal cation (Fe/Co/Zn/Cd) transporter